MSQRRSQSDVNKLWRSMDWDRYDAPPMLPKPRPKDESGLEELFRPQYVGAINQPNVGTSDLVVTGEPEPNPFEEAIKGHGGVEPRSLEDYHEWLAEDNQLRANQYKNGFEEKHADPYEAAWEMAQVRTDFMALAGFTPLEANGPGTPEDGSGFKSSVGIKRNPDDVDETGEPLNSTFLVSTGTSADGPFKEYSRDEVIKQFPDVNIAELDAGQQYFRGVVDSTAKDGGELVYEAYGHSINETSVDTEKLTYKPKEEKPAEPSNFKADTPKPEKIKHEKPAPQRQDNRKQASYLQERYGVGQVTTSQFEYHGPETSKDSAERPQPSAKDGAPSHPLPLMGNAPPAIPGQPVPAKSEQSIVQNDQLVGAVDTALERLLLLLDRMAQRYQSFSQRLGVIETILDRSR